jgi:threonine dehydrogenase-like Zn-dependent dehydrogenase
MKALVYTAPAALDYGDMPDPAPAQGEQLIRIDSVGICGSDMHAFLGHDDRRPAPLILGHEGAGTITGGRRDGERVTINPLVTCGTCPACTSGRDNLCATRQIISMPPREGAFAQYVAMPDRNLVQVPEGFALEAAALAEPVAVSWHAVRLGLDMLPDTRRDMGLVIGGGAIGVAAALSLRA